MQGVGRHANKAKSKNWQDRGTQRPRGSGCWSPTRDERPGIAVGGGRHQEARCKSRRSHRPLWLRTRWRESEASNACRPQRVSLCPWPVWLRERDTGGDSDPHRYLLCAWHCAGSSFPPPNSSLLWAFKAPQTGKRDPDKVRDLPNSPTVTFPLGSPPSLQTNQTEGGPPCRNPAA